MQRSIRYLASAVVLVCLGCSKPPAKSADEAAGGASAGEQGALAPEQRPELTAASAPADVFAVARISSPAALTDTLGKWSNLTMDWRALLREMAGPIDQTVLLDKPVEAAAMLDGKSSSTPKVLFAVSIGLSSLRNAHDYLQSKGAVLTAGPAGSFHVEMEGAHCLLAWAMGAAPVRLVCSDKARALDELGPYLTRGLPGEALVSSELFVEVRAEPWRRRFGRQVQMVKLGVPFVLRELELDHPAFDSVVSDTLYSLADEVVQLSDDLDAVRLLGKMQPATQTMDFSMSIKLRGQRSWLGQWLREAEQSMAAPPEMFWSLPGAAHDAGYHAQVSGPRQQALVAGMSKLLGGALDYLGVPARLRQDTTRAFDTFCKDAGPTCEAGGDTSTSASSARGDDYHLTGSSEKGQLDQLLQQLYLVYSQPATRKVLEKKFEIKEWPQVISRRPSAGSGLPATTTVYEMSLPANLRELFSRGGSSDPAKKLYVASLDVAGRNWLATASDEKLLAQQLNAMASTAAKATLADNRRLDPLRQSRTLGAGFFTVNSSLAAIRDLAPELKLKASSLEHGGTTPILYRSVVAGGGTELSFSVSLPKPVMADVAAAVMAIAAQGDELFAGSAVQD
jgi:hypothetical protein